MKKRIASVIQSRGKLLLVAICVSVGLGAFAVQSLGSFGKARGFAVGTGPWSVAIGDFNGDNKRDLAVANRSSNNVSVLLGNGAGSFGKAKSFTVGDRPDSVAVGNFNDDTRPDLAVANFGSGNVSILLGKGDGTFGAARNFPVGDGTYPTSLAVGNFNDDTRPDLAVTNSAGVSVLLGNGDGTFGPATNYPTGANPASVAVGNFNADAKLDLAVANRGAIDCEGRLGRDAQTSSCIGGFGTVSILLGNGDGSFGPATNFPVGEGSDPISIAAGDFNGDHRPDLALADYPLAYYSERNSVSVLFGKGAGAFGAPKSFAVGFSPISVAVGNLNGDSHPDLAVANKDSGDVTVLLGNGAGSFGGRRSFGVGGRIKSFGVAGRGSPTAVAIGKLNAGTDPDLAVTTGGPDKVWVLLNAGPSPRKLTLAYRRDDHRFTGRLSSADPACIRGQRVRIMLRRRGPDRQVGSAISAANGAYKIGQSAKPGTYYASVRSWSACRAKNSKAITLR